MSKKVLFWDFDGTLGFRKGGMWSSALLEALYEIEQECKWTIEDIKPLVQKGFPWHQPDIVHTNLNTPDLWWNNLKSSVIKKAFLALGYTETKSTDLANLTHKKYIDINCWSLYDDVIPTLGKLSKKGWIHAVVSNHIPELEVIIDGLGLSKYLSAVINSAKVGYEKPHPEIYKLALEKTYYPDQVWMIGDNFIADVMGAEKVGIKGILVRKRDLKATHQCDNLPLVLDIL